MRGTLVRLALGFMMSTALVATASAQATKSTAETAKPAAKKAVGKIDLNKATAEQLQELPGVGPVHAADIIKARPFKTVSDLKSVKGIHESLYTSLLPHVKVTEEPEKKAMTKKVDLNTATADQLQELPGIGPVRAAEIIKARPFKSVEALKDVKGMTESAYTELVPHVIVHTAATPKPTMTKEKMTRTEATPTPKKAATPTPAPTTTATTKEEMPKTAAKTTPKKAVTKAAAKEAEEDDPKRVSRKKAALAAGRLININTADEKELQELPGIGPVRAAAIVEKRPFAKVEDIMGVTGIKEGIFGQIKDHISVK